MAKMAKTWPLWICLMLMIKMTCAWLQKSSMTITTILDYSSPSTPLWLYPQVCRTYLRPEWSCRGEDRLRPVEEAIVRLLGFGVGGRPFPETQEQLVTYCQESRVLLRQIKTDLAGCFVHKRDIFPVKILRPLNDITDHVCDMSMRKNEERTGNMLSMGKCLNRNVDRTYYGCSKQFMDDTKQLYNYHDDLKKKAFFCCNLHKLMECNKSQIDFLPCLKPTSAFAAKFMNRWATGVMKVHCNFKKGSIEVCDSHQVPDPPVMNFAEYKSPVLVALDWYDSVKAYREAPPGPTEDPVF